MRLTNDVIHAAFQLGAEETGRSCKRKPPTIMDPVVPFQVMCSTLRHVGFEGVVPNRVGSVRKRILLGKKR